MPSATRWRWSDSNIMVEKNMQKKGFSLFEAVVVMMVASVFIAVMANSIPHKVKPKVRADAHGRFECYYKGNTLYQRQVIDGSAPIETLATNPSYCEFKPNPYAQYIVINAVGGGAGGVARTNNSGSAGEFSSMFVPAPETVYRLRPGRGGSAGNSGMPTTVDSCGSRCSLADAFNEALRVEGGSSTMSIISQRPENLQSCDIVAENSSGAFNCNTNARCEILNGGQVLQVSFCRRTDFYRTMDIPFESSNNTWNSIKGNKCRRNDGIGTFVLYDVSAFSDYKIPATNNGVPTCGQANIPFGSNPLWNVGENNLRSSSIPSFYKMRLVFDTNVGLPQEGTPSDMTRYVTAMRYNAGVGLLNPGNGGAVGNPGSAGAVIIMW